MGKGKGKKAPLFFFVLFFQLLFEACFDSFFLFLFLVSFFLCLWGVPMGTPQFIFFFCDCRTITNQNRLGMKRRGDKEWGGKSKIGGKIEKKKGSRPF